MKAKRIQVKDGNLVAPIYQFSDGRDCMDALLGTMPDRITKTSLEKADVQPRKRLITQIASSRAHEEQMTLEDLQDYSIQLEG